jgi:hypothetical protein
MIDDTEFALGIALLVAAFVVGLIFGAVAVLAV